MTRMQRFRILPLLGVLALAPGLQAAGAAPSAASSAAKTPADTIYLGTTITMEPGAPQAEAVAVRGAEIVAVGTRAAVLRLRGKRTQVVELGTRTLLPGLVDSHGHFTVVAALIDQANLAPPPAGPVGSIAELQDALRRQMREQAIPDGGWVIGFGYDDSLLAEKRHPNRDDLDAISTTHRIYVTHVSGHLGAANSNVLADARIDASSVDPPGGVIRRRAGSHEPDGVLEETAQYGVRALFPQPDRERSLQLLGKAQDFYASMGLTTIQDGGLAPDGVALLQEAARRKLLQLDVVGYRIWMPVGAPFPAADAFGDYRDRLKIAGIKMVLDGSPQGKTAYLSEPYVVPPAGQKQGYRGYPSMPPSAVEKGVREALTHDVPLLAHANGDAAAQLLIDAVAKVRQETGNLEPKVVMIHAQTVRDDQLEQMATLNIVPSFFTGHTFFWGDWHRDETLGVRRAERTSPARSAIERGIAFTLHNDPPVVPPDMMRTLWSAVTRRTRSNDILGPAQRLTVMEALAGLTINGARQYGEEDRKGSIAVGKLADLVILDRNPLEVEPDALAQIKVVETISQGRSIYRLP